MQNNRTPTTVTQLWYS